MNAYVRDLISYSRMGAVDEQIADGVAFRGEQLDERFFLLIGGVLALLRWPLCESGRKAGH